MIGERGAQNLFNQIFKIWIEPEITRRKKNGSLPENFRIYRCLIRLPQNHVPIIEFNEEIGLIASIQIAPDTSVVKGQHIYLHEVQKIEAVKPPEVDGTRVAFIYIYYTGGGVYQIAFDFTPNLPEEFLSENVKETWELGQAIAESLQDILIEKTIRVHDRTQNLLQNIGLWAVPTLLPYPISKIVKLIEEENFEDAKRTLVLYCTPEFIEDLSPKWWEIVQFNQRKELIKDALYAHKNGRYRLSIHTLIPHLEGIITDWIYTQLPEGEIPWRQESKTKKFRDLILDRPPTTYTYKRIVESTMDFILGGPVLKTFKRWVDQIDDAFPNRHVVQHGKYDNSLFTEENSIKLFLLLDTIYYIIVTQE